MVVPSSDVVSMTISTEHEAASVVSAYDVKSAGGQASIEGRLRAKLQVVKEAYEERAGQGEAISSYCCVLTSIDSTCC